MGREFQRRRGTATEKVLSLAAHTCTVALLQTDTLNLMALSILLKRAKKVFSLYTQASLAARVLDGFLICQLP